jgi:PAS domain S-box-containing protein
MKDRRSPHARRWLLEPGQPVPADAERAAAWQAEFASGGAFRSAFEHAAIGMAIVDLDGRFLKVNRSLCQIVGYSETELEATDFQSITHPDDLEADLARSRKLLAGEIAQLHLEKRYFHRDGSIVWIDLSASVVRDSQGAPYYVVSQIQDISARKEAEQQLARRLREMERLTQTVPAVLQAFEAEDDQEGYAAALGRILEAFASPAGLFLSFSDQGVLGGVYLSETGVTNVRCPPSLRSEAWTSALASGNVEVNNGPQQMGCGRTVARSLVAPIVYDGEPLGLFHVGDGPRDYDPHDGDLLARVSRMIAPVLRARLRRGKLTPREAEVMDLLVAGKSQKEIAVALNISVQTAAKHRARVLEKLDVKNDVELVRLALEMRPQDVRFDG